MFRLLLHIAYAGIKVFAVVIMLGNFGGMMRSRKDASMSHNEKIESMLCDMAMMMITGMMLCS